MAEEAPGPTAEGEVPFFLQGNFLPVHDELTVADLPLEGALPPELRGLYVRNGSNPPSGSLGHFFLGEGMLHGVRLEEGRAAWYRNRYVKTPHITNPDGATRQREDGSIDRSVSLANTHIIAHAGKLLALEEGSFPYVVDRELETVGFDDYGGKLRSAMSAHSKVCPVTGELLSFGYSSVAPHLTYLRISPEGRLVQSEEIAVTGATMMHDFAITERHVVFFDLPVVFDPSMTGMGTMPYHWSDDYPARLGVMPRLGSNADVQWFEVEPCYIFHHVNAYDDGDEVVIDACRSTNTWRRADDPGDEPTLTLRRFRLDRRTGRASEEMLDERSVEFPRVADAMIGQPHRYAYLLEMGEDDGAPSMAGLLKRDFQTGASVSHAFGGGCNAGEPVFVAAAGSDPTGDDGWVLTFVHDESSEQTELVVLDASRFDAAPVARVKLPRRVPYGFHGSWIADD